MKTAIIKTNFWLEDEIFGLNSDTRYLYLCILTNPQRDITPAFKCSDRLMSAYTGYSLSLIDICRKQLIESGFINYVDGYYILTSQNYVEPSKGRDTKIIYDRYFSELPENIKVFLSDSTSTSTSTTTSVIVKDKDNNKDKDKDTFGEFENVKLTEEEYNKLVEKLGENNTKLMIEELSTGIASKGYKYKSHYATILSWSRRRVTKLQERNQPKQRTIV